jgi:predicted RNA-binding Zn-ribbon protein involved in translation (DUF1610 family)
MAEYIEKEKLVDGLDKTLKNIPSFPSDPIGRELVALGIETVIKTVKALPAADVRPVVRGEWSRIDYEPHGHDYKCSACGWKNDMPTHFCPNCGAAMEET